MRLLGLTSFQAALLAGGTSGTVILFYLLKLRRRRILISSSLLWSRVLEQQRGFFRKEKLRKLISIGVALAISLSIVFALARPEIASSGRSQRIAIVLDTSPTMNTRTHDKSTRWQHALTEAKKLLESGDPATEFRVVDTSGQVETQYTSDRKELRSLVERMSPSNVEPEFPGIDDRDAEVYFISDGVAVQRIPSEVRRISVFESANNVGITAFKIRNIAASSVAHEAYLEIQNSGEPTQATVALRDASGELLKKTVPLNAKENYQLVLDLSHFAGGEIEATVRASGDALSSDDVATASSPLKRKLRTLLVTRSNKPLSTLLNTDPDVDLIVTDPSKFRESADVDAYIFDNFVPPKPPSHPALFIGVPSASWLTPSVRKSQKPQLTVWAGNHPLMRSVPMRDVHIEQANRIDAKEFLVLAASPDTPLIVASENPKSVLLTFDLASSDFTLQVGFPIFIKNVLTWFGGDRLASPRTPNRNQSFSDINHTVFKSQSSSRGNERPQLRRELWFYLLFLAFALVSIEWFTYHHRVTL